MVLFRLFRHQMAYHCTQSIHYEDLMYSATQLILSRCSRPHHPIVTTWVPQATMGGGRRPNSQIGFSAGWPLTTETSTPDLINPALRQHTFHRESPTIPTGKFYRLRSSRPLRLSPAGSTLSVEGKSSPVNKPEPAASPPRRGALINNRASLPTQPDGPLSQSFRDRHPGRIQNLA